MGLSPELICVVVIAQIWTKLWECDEVTSSPQGSGSYLNNQNEVLALKKEVYLILNQLTNAQF